MLRGASCRMTLSDHVWVGRGMVTDAVASRSTRGGRPGAELEAAGLQPPAQSRWPAGLFSLRLRRRLETLRGV